MRFFLYEIVARIVGLYMVVDCSRTLWSGYHEQKITSFQPNWIAWVLDGSDPVVHRDASPFRYWMEMGTQGSLALAGLFVAILGWHLTS